MEGEMITLWGYDDDEGLTCQDLLLNLSRLHHCSGSVANRVVG